MSGTQGVFSKVRPELDFPSDEAKILAFWKERKIFEKSLLAETRQTGPSKGTFVFYEGPPTANGMPHNGHVLTRAVKDVFPRYKTMQGFDVPRRAGWDTHGLPVEVEVEKELRIHGKEDIEKYGVEPFTHRCIESVFRYTEAWERLTDKIAFWVDLPSAYVTFHRSYVESVWWSLSKLFEKGLLYKGDKIVWWWAQGGTALSAAEVGQGYKTVDDPSVFVAFPLAFDEKTALLVWTTTPWTLPSNMYAAVNVSFEYAFVTGAGDRTLVVAKDLVPKLAEKLKVELTIVKTVKGSELVGTKYVPPFDTFAEQAASQDVVHTVIAADFVLMDASGIVHIAPAFGEDDYKAHRGLISKTRPFSPLFCAVKPDGTFIEALPKYVGRFVKDCDKELQHELKERGLLVHAEAYRHEYPFCWRADSDPLIQYARPAWYIQTTRENTRALENNQAVKWLPDHIKEGRFGDFLRNNVDWALSRERYWGTPLNLWICEADASHIVAPESVAKIEELGGSFQKFHDARAKDPTLSEHLMVHKPWIDDVSFACPMCAKSGAKAGTTSTMRRVSEVIDCWYDSGCMPFAQWGYPHAKGSKADFERSFPADFISEAIDQTRGWFYSLLMISTLVFDEATQKEMGLATVRPVPHPYKTCVVLGHVGDREGKKESKSKGNYTPPEIILERVRMEFAVVPPGTVKGLEPKPGEAFVAREDYEGLDLTGEAANVAMYLGGASEGEPRKTTLRPTKAIPRRVIVMHADDAAALGVAPGAKALDVKPVEVPRLPAVEKVWVEDPSSPAPGADAFRWFFYAASPSWTNTRHSLTNVRLEQKEFLVKLRNVYSFFSIYGNIDGFDPKDRRLERPAKDRSELDRWILSELALVTERVTEALDGYLLYDAARALVDLTESLSNWYIRRSRARFWSHGHFGSGSDGGDGSANTDKADAYFTLYEVLTTLARLIAPFVPYFAEEMWQNLVRGPLGDAAPESVHLAAFPVVDAAAKDVALAREMRAVREVVSLGLGVRTNAKLRVRQPLKRVDIVASDPELVPALRAKSDLIAEELNVKEVRLLAPGEEAGFVKYALKPNFKALGPKLGKQVQACKAALAKADAGALRTELSTRGKIDLALEGGTTLELGPEEVDVAVEAAPGYAAAGGRVGVVVLAIEIDEALRDEGLAREVLAKVQAFRKDSGLEFADRIRLHVTGSEAIVRVASANREMLARESLATAISVGEEKRVVDSEPKTFTVDGDALVLSLVRDA